MTLKDSLGYWSPPASRKLASKKKLGSRKCNWRGMPTSLGVNFGRELFEGEPDILEKQDRKTRGKTNCHRNSLRNSPAIFLKFARPN